MAGEPEGCTIAVLATDGVEQVDSPSRSCHGPWTLIDADGVRGKTMTSWPSLKTDLSNAGAEWG
jgi:hypothetical protein